MKKQIAAVAGATLGLMMLGGQAFAGEQHPSHPSHDSNGQVGLINVADPSALNDISGTLGLCGNDVPVLGVLLPIASPDTTGKCAHGGNGDAVLP